MTRSTTFRSWALAALAMLALGACNRDWDGSRAAAIGAGAAGIATAQDALGMSASAGVPGMQAGTAAGARPAFASLPDRGDLVGYPRQRTERREGAYTWHRADVSEEHALRAIVDRELRITAPNGQLLAFEYERHVEHPTGDWTWIGRLRDAPPGRQAILTFGARAVFGSIAQAVSEPLRLTMRDGASWLVETDPAQLAGVEAQVLRPEAPDFLVPPLYFGNPAAPTASGDSHTTSSSAQSIESASSTTSSTATVVDVLVGYTPGFATYHGGDSQARTRINFLVDVANQGYINSQIDARVRLVHAMPVNYPDATDNGDTLEKMTGYKSGTGKTTPDPAFSELRNARETYGADLVTLIRKFNTPENDGCGIAWLIGGGLTTITQGYEYFGYSVVGDGIDQGTDGKNYFCREETMVHEFGHNMGSAHDIETAKGDDGVLQTKEYGAYTYSFGYRTGPGAGDFYTIMAYREKRETGTQQQPYRVFSNPEITFCGSYPCGTGSADNARSLRQTMPIIATFRSTVVPPSEAAGYVRNDVDGDGRSDVVWIAPRTRDIAVWAMSGASIRQSLTGTKVTEGHVALGMGDFNGDRKADLMITNGSHVRLAFGDGTGFVHFQLVSTHPPAGWDFAGIADVTGDGRSDVIWHNVQSGEVYVWFMDGGQISGGRGGSYLPAGHRVSGLGDLDGDGKVDLVTTSSLEVRMSQGLGLGAFGESVRIADRPPALWDFAGVGKFDGESRADILWHNVRSGELYTWLMDGARIVDGRGNAFIPLGQRVVDVLDLNGDGYDDVLSAGPAEVRASMGRLTGLGASTLVVAGRDRSWQLANSKRDQRPPLDLNGDGRSDAVWHNRWSAELYYWLLDGVSLVEQQGESFLQAGYRPLVAADFDGDGRPDILSTNGSAISLSPGLPGGGFGTPLHVTAHPTGAWRFGGVADFNGDGAADIVWFNEISGELYRWLMQGPQIAGEAGGVFLPAGHELLGIGDLSADGFPDFLTSNGAEIYALRGYDGGYSVPQYISALPASDWALAGIADVNQDGKVDITWHNRVSGELYTWVMVHTSILRGQGGSYLPVGHEVMGMRDLDGDRRPDVISTDGEGVWGALAIPGGGFIAPTRIAALPAEGWSPVPSP
jgi:peptidyl-Asp metalloendopeptidase